MVQGDPWCTGCLSTRGASNSVHVGRPVFKHHPFVFRVSWGGDNYNTHRAGPDCGWPLAWAGCYHSSFKCRHFVIFHFFFLPASENTLTDVQGIGIFRFVSPPPHCFSQILGTTFVMTQTLCQNKIISRKSFLSGYPSTCLFCSLLGSVNGPDSGCIGKAFS